MEYSFQIDKLPEKINFLNNKAREINRNLFLFDDFKLKKVPHIVDEEIVFWYLIVNLYGLFFDAGKYIRDLDIWNYDSYCKVKAFYYALNEVRAVFCHNKSNASYLRGKVINKKLNKLIPGWLNKVEDGGKHLLDREFQSLSPHKDLYDLFFAAALKVLELIDSEILDRFKKYNDTNIYADWFLPISKWYYSQNIVIYTRAFKAFCYENARKLKDQGSISCIDDDAIEDFVFREIVGKEKEIKGYSCCLINSEYLEYMYKTYFSCNATTANRRKLSPRNLLNPLLEKKFWGIPLPVQIEYDDKFPS